MWLVFFGFLILKERRDVFLLEVFFMIVQNGNALSSKKMACIHRILSFYDVHLLCLLKVLTSNVKTDRFSFPLHVIFFLNGIPALLCSYSYFAIFFATRLFCHKYWPSLSTCCELSRIIYSISTIFKDCYSL